jgi:hypothetical protein
MDFPVVKFDAVKAVGNEADDDTAASDANEFTIGPEGKSLLSAQIAWDFCSAAEP